jgi:hypothetical protein
MSELPSLRVPPPCDSCSRRLHCRVHCIAFAHYVSGLPWQADERPAQLEIITMETPTGWRDGTRRCTRCNQRQPMRGGKGGSKGRFVCADCIKRAKDAAAQRRAP